MLPAVLNVFWFDRVPCITKLKVIFISETKLIQFKVQQKSFDYEYLYLAFPFDAFYAKYASLALTFHYKMLSNICQKFLATPFDYSGILWVIQHLRRGFLDFPITKIFRLSNLYCSKLLMQLVRLRIFFASIQALLSIQIYVF